MKKILSSMLVIVGIASILFASFTIVNYGAHSMRRVNTSACEYRLKKHGP